MLGLLVWVGYCLCFRGFVDWLINVGVGTLEVGGFVFSWWFVDFRYGLVGLYLVA